MLWQSLTAMARPRRAVVIHHPSTDWAADPHRVAVMRLPNTRVDSRAKVWSKKPCHRLLVCPAGGHLLRALRVLPRCDGGQPMANHEAHPTEEPRHLGHLLGNLLATRKHLLGFLV